MRKKALLVANRGGFLATFEANNIKLLQDLGFEVHCASNFSPTIDNAGWNKIYDLNVKVHDINIERNPWSIGNIEALHSLRKLIKKEGFSIIHAHTPVGGMLARIAAKTCTGFNGRIIYTAHGFHFYNGAPFANWLLFFPIEWLLSWFTDVLITINGEDYRRACSLMHAKENMYVPGVGIDIKRFLNLYSGDREERERLRIGEKELVFLSVGGLISRKNQKIVIEALARTGDWDYKYCIAGDGIQKEELGRIAKINGIEGKVLFLGYREDVELLYKLADVVILPSFQEGLPVALMEAIACKKPIIASKIRGNVDLIKNNTWMFNPYNTKGLIKILKKIKKKRMKIDRVFERDIKDNYDNLKQFDISNVQRRMKKIYTDTIV